MILARASATIGGMDKLSDLTRRLENLIRGGTIAEIDQNAPLCRVKSGGLVSAWLPFFAPRAGTDSEWDPPSIGEQCVILSPSGDPATGFVLVGIYSNQFPAPDTSLTRHRRKYRDGAVIDYDTDTHTLTATLPSGGKVDVVAPGGMSIVGNLDVDGLINSTQDVTAGPQKISLINHRTSGVQRGGGVSDGPVP
ncbi:phage baseplate assembly protein V [Pseudomonas baltica]|uniref:phage baseplate assembly protein V n=1 Tax=Pseudomonas baltica TaxID=2762576 RepID=UPI00289C0C02|nr:phage baseplate assembly protein V [Pseudomonas baltica]